MNGTWEDNSLFIRKLLHTALDRWKWAKQRGRHLRQLSLHSETTSATEITEKKYRNSDCPYIFESQTEQQLLWDFNDDENYRDPDCPFTFLKAKQNNYYETLMTMRLPKFGLFILIFESQTEETF